MKNLKVLSAAIVVAFALSAPAYAGDVLTPGLTSPPPPPRLLTQPLVGISNPDVPSTTPGNTETPKLVDLLWAIISIF
jgi:hypothetical protein